VDEQEHVVATSAAHTIQFSTMSNRVSCDYQFARGQKPYHLLVKRPVYGGTPRFGGPDVIFEPSRLSEPFPAEPLTPRHLRVPPPARRPTVVRFSQASFQSPPVKGNLFAPTRTPPPYKTSEEVLSNSRLSTLPDDPTLFAPRPSGPLR
jgi:hypothetical protein